MCGRFVQKSSGSVLARLLGLRDEPDLAPRYNVAPMQPVAAVRSGALGERRLDELKWGLVPPWADDPAIGSRMINARSETAAAKPAFRSAFRSRRCLIPADGFYEWLREGKSRRPHYIYPQDGVPLALAGLWEERTGEDGAVLTTCTILTTAANELVGTLHDRMPVILPAEAHAAWLGEEAAESEELQALMRPLPEGRLALHEVERRVGQVANDDPGLIEPKPPEPEQLSLL